MGVEIAGLDLSVPIAPETREAIHAALLAYHVVVFPRQVLSRERQCELAAAFGEVEPAGPGKRDGVAHVLSNLDADGRPALRVSPAANYHWHTDKPYRAAPPMLTMLYAVEVPPPEADGTGDTEFADTAAAYDALPEDTKSRIAGLRVTFRPAFDPSRPEVDHPLVRTHPETGRNALYLGNHATGIAGLPAAEGRALLAELLEHATQPRFVYRHRWQEGDLVIWDNRCLLHRLVAGEALRRHRRILHRSIVRGTVF